MPEEARRGRVEERPRWQELSKKAKQDFESKTFCFIYGKILGLRAYFTSYSCSCGHAMDQIMGTGQGVEGGGVAPCWYIYIDYSEPTGRGAPRERASFLCFNY